MATATTTATAPRSVCHDDRGNAFAAGDLLMSHHRARAKRHSSSECRDYIRHHIKLIGCRHRHDQIGPARATRASDGNHGRHAGHSCLGKHPACQRLNVGSGRPRYGLPNAETRPLPTSRGQHLLPGQRNAEFDDPEQHHDQDGKQEGKLNGSGASLVRTARHWRPPASEPAVGALRSARQRAAESHPCILTRIPDDVSGTLQAMAVVFGMSEIERLTHHAVCLRMHVVRRRRHCGADRLFHPRRRLRWSNHSTVL